MILCDGVVEMTEAIVNTPVAVSPVRLDADLGIDTPVSTPATGWSLDQIITQLNRGNARWANPSQVTFGFPTTLPSDYSSSGTEGSGFMAFTASQMAATRDILQLYSDICNINFVETSGDTADIRLQNSNTLGSYEAAHAYYPGAGVGGDVWVNSSYPQQLDMTLGNYGYHTILHELGHSLGQPHPGDYNAGNGTPSYQNDALFFEDSRQYTVMSYWSASNTGANHLSYYAETPLLLDIAALQAKYGANMTTRTGDTVYGFNSTAARAAFDFTQNLHPIVCIWDAGGNDTLDLSGYSTASNINLNPGTFSDAGGMTKNISIAYGCDIENAVGGGGDDTIVGNALGNRLVGNAGADTFTPGSGNDVVDGGAGTDTVLLTGEVSDYTVTQTGATTYSFVHGTETDTLIDVEQIRMTDGTTYTIENFINDTFDALRYICSYADLIQAFGDDAAAGRAHWLEHGQAEGRNPRLFDTLAYIASYGDLIGAFGTNQQAAETHYIRNGFMEGRTVTFDVVKYVAGYADLMAVFGASQNWAGATRHYIQNGWFEGRSTNAFDALSYIASYGDLIRAFGSNADAGVHHYVMNGYGEGRTITFDALNYIASYGDLIAAFGTDTQSAARHYIDYGFNEGRTITFNALAYIASFVDLIQAFGANALAGVSHWIEHGLAEGRQTSFDAITYRLANVDVVGFAVTFDTSTLAADWIGNYGALNHNGRTLTGLYGSEQTDHVLTLGQSRQDTLATTGDRDWFAVTLEAGQSYAIQVSANGGGGGTLGDSYLRLYGANGALISSDDDGGPGNDSLINFTATTTGTYYIAIGSYGDRSSGTYTVRVVDGYIAPSEILELADGITSPNVFTQPSVATVLTTIDETKTVPTTDVTTTTGRVWTFPTTTTTTTTTTTDTTTVPTTDDTTTTGGGWTVPTTTVTTTDDTTVTGAGWTLPTTQVTTTDDTTTVTGGTMTTLGELAFADTTDRDWTSTATDIRLAAVNRQSLSYGAIGASGSLFAMAVGA